MSVSRYLGKIQSVAMEDEPFPLQQKGTPRFEGDREGSVMPQ